MKGKMNIKVKKRVAVLLLLTILVSAISGCGKNVAGNGNEVSTDNAEGTNGGIDGEKGNDASTTEDIVKDSQDNETKQPTEPTAMGRYVETVTDLSERLSGFRNRLFRLADGTLIITDASTPFLVSKDNGESWEEDKSAWRLRMIEEEHSILNIAISADNTVAAVYGDRDEAGEYIQRILIVKPDGTEIPVEMPLGTDYPNVAAIADNGRIFFNIMGSDELYEVKEDGSCDLFLTIQEGNPGFLQFQGDLLVIDGPTYNNPIFYDIEKREYIEDETLSDFAKEEYNGGNKFNNDDGYEMYIFPGEEGVLYTAGEKGMHRHVIGGSAIEQIIDGSLCTFSNPAYRVQSVLMLDNNEFLAIFTGSRLVRFVYDPDMPTVPNERLKVYSLKENSTIQQAISLYQSKNPEVFVDYEIGISQGSSLTREDAVKNLNTKIMAGEGPDVLILDNLPMDSFMEKGLLMDLTPLLNGLNGEEELFGNIVDAMKMKDGIYAMPCEIEIPVVYGKEEYISQIKDLEGIADTIEQLRKDNPEKNLINLCSEKGVMRFFSMVCVPAWITADDKIDKEAIGKFLEQAKRIYDAQMDGLPQKLIDSYNRTNEFWVKEFGETREDSAYLRSGVDAASYACGYRSLILGTIDGFWSYPEMISVNRVAGFEDDVWSLMNGQSSNVFCAETLLGINAVSPYIEQAEDFVKLCLGKESQMNLFGGFAVNKAAIAESGIADPTVVDEDGAYSWQNASGEDGFRIEFVSYWPSQEQLSELQKCIESVKTPYIENMMLENAVYEGGAEYLRGRMSLEEAIEFIEKKIALYMAE